MQTEKSTRSVFPSLKQILVKGVTCSRFPCDASAKARATPLGTARCSTPG